MISYRWKCEKTDIFATLPDRDDGMAASSKFARLRVWKRLGGIGLHRKATYLIGILQKKKIPLVYDEHP